MAGAGGAAGLVAAASVAAGAPITAAGVGTPVGYAAISGNGHGPTTGGAGGPTVTVTSLSQLETEAARSAAEVIRVSGRFSGSGEVSVASNKTIIGVGSGSGLTGIGLKDSPVDGFVNQSGNDFGGGTNNITQIGTFTRPPYSFTLDPTANVPAIVAAGAGVGKVSG